MTGDRDLDEQPSPESPVPSPVVSRRDALRAFAAIPLAGVFDIGNADIDRAMRGVHPPQHGSQQPASPATPTKAATQPGAARKFFTAHEYATVRVLVDMIIPRDERSGSATEAKVPEFMDALLADESVSSKNRQMAMRGGLAWFDREAHARWGTTFARATAKQRAELLDLIAWPQKAPKELSQGAAFFGSFRDLTASGFWSSPMGRADLRYLGATFVPEWKGCPSDVLNKLGVSYGEA